MAVLAHEMGHLFGLEDLGPPIPLSRLMKAEIKTKRAFNLDTLHLSSEEKQIVRQSPLIHLL